MSSIDAIKKKVQMTTTQLQEYSPSDDTDIKFQEMRKDPKYKDWTDDELREQAGLLIANKNSRAVSLRYETTLLQSGKPNDPIWAGFSYEEILHMEDNGVKIPKEIIDWAHSMQAANTTEYQLESGDTKNINDSETLKANVGEAGESGKIKVAKAMNKQAILQEEALREATQEFERYSSTLKTVTNEAEASQKNMLNNVQVMMNQFKDIDTKVKRGEELTQGERALYGQLGIMMNNQVQASNIQIENYTSDFEEIAKVMKGTEKEVKVSQEYVAEISLNAEHIKEYEVGVKTKSVPGNNSAFDGTVGIVSLLKANAIAQNFTVTSLLNSNTLQNATIESNQTIKTVGNQMTSMTQDVNGREEKAQVLVDNEQTEMSEETAIKQPADKIEPPATEDNPDVLKEIDKHNENQDENVFAKEDDLNDIDTILKQQQRKAPTPQKQDVIIE